ncbi:MAG: F0F1 ATP synthase subunit B [Bacteroidales bacterium]|nr:F0F1 ATP synthase subunit B [Bacteroidales bacterium]MDY4941829.1 F0F1 ATP synthase subunit B [Candidatus Limisoma sp.]MDD7604544.1 F0F1 ATP synthase subunit B [Bacteroidales bacterium]MDD7759503.1 F0F1 ATP synthase subunit B [Bacteroidales bacterium]MDY5894486.1 F0F1 ATP synthase subunit B [Candidatus Limisoma sp.]
MELFKPDFGLVFWMFVVLVLLCILLGKYAWPVIIKMMTERADLIDKGVVYAQEAKEHLDNAKAEADKYIQEAKRQQSEILREAAKMKSQIIEDAKQAASVEAQKVMDAARAAIEQERKEAQLQFRNEVSQFSILIAEKLLRDKMSDQKAQSQLVDKLLSEIDKN